MSDLNKVEELQRAGRYLEALEAIDRAQIFRSNRLNADVLRAELLERTGRYRESRFLSERLLNTHDLSPEYRARCECVLGLVDTDEGNTQQATFHFQRAVSLAQSAKNPRLACLIQLRLIVLLADTSGHQAIAPLLARVRAEVTRIGDPLVSATLHIFMGEIEARRGLLQNGVRHTLLGQNILADSENLWLSAMAENTLVAVAIMRTDVDDGIARAQSAWELAEESGAAAMRRATLANLGNLFYQIGDFDKAVEHFERARSILGTFGERDNGTLDSIALTCLAQGRIDEAEAFLNRIDGSVTNESDWLLYGNRHSRLTRALLLVRQGRYTEAATQVDWVLKGASEVSDNLLYGLAQILRVELLQRNGDTENLCQLLHDVAVSLPTAASHLHARYLQLLLRGNVTAGNLVAAKGYFESAKRVYEGLRIVPGLLELTSTWNQVLKSVSLPQNTNEISGLVYTAADQLLQDVAGMLLHLGRPALVAADIVAILSKTDGVVSATAVSRDSGGSVRTIASYTRPSVREHKGSLHKRNLPVGISRNESFEIEVQVVDKFESIASWNAIALLLETIHDLEQAHTEREQRLTLWPLDEISREGEQTVIMGKMGELMSFARRIARANVSVLITGESGTGKEILARAIHGYSARAEKPFVPFNCTAVPRELLESHLFGYRRGAFTGADRDNPGLIRAARDGALFFDEIGELGLDLQPKLLRFLESGEINPLGEPGPLTVDVRIIAATNSNLEELVQQERFREDLFYRLNVIRLTIPPLRERRDEIPALVHHFVARAAQEFGKGRMRVSEDTMEQLLLYAWPGNIRQLNNELRRMVALAEQDSTLQPAALSKEILRAMPKAARASGTELAVPLTDKLVPTLSRIEREMIKAALKTNQGRVDAAAKALGISRKGLYLKRQRFGL
jgi:transcriptional regulator with PAS, ATPase and Fis domain